MFEESIITQSILVLTVFGTMAYCIIAEHEIPDILNQYGMVIIGFFFGAKSTLQVRKGVEEWKSQSLSR
jgi:hypothetical protein